MYADLEYVTYCKTMLIYNNILPYNIIYNILNILNNTYIMSNFADSTI